MFILFYSLTVTIGQAMEEFGRGKVIGVIDVLEIFLIAMILIEYFIAIGVRGKDYTDGWIIID